MILFLDFSFDCISCDDDDDDDMSVTIVLFHRYKCEDAFFPCVNSIDSDLVYFVRPIRVHDKFDRIPT